MKLLMHTCCAPCSVYCIDELRSRGIEPTLYWYNPNIHPYTEYMARRDCVKEYAQKINVKAVFEDEYGLDEFCKNVSKNINARCVNYCYLVRLRKTFEYAKANGYDTVTTTLLYSIYQKHDFIKKLMEDLRKEFEIDFLYIDFRKGFWQGHEKAIEQGLYMQKYCGCIFSEEQSFLDNTNNKPKLPDGFEFLPVKKSINIKKERNNKEQYINLLLEADQSKDMINRYLKNADLFVCSSLNEGYNLAISEAVILGVPVISTDCSGIKENLGNGKWGYIVENRKETLYHAISRCFDEPGFLEELKKKSEAGSIQDTYEGRLKKIESIIEGVVN